MSRFVLQYCLGATGASPALLDLQAADVDAAIVEAQQEIAVDTPARITLVDGRGRPGVIVWESGRCGSIPCGAGCLELGKR